ncbi:distal tail protein [Virgibacillus phage Mimir87]|nr:distal tail protein [Virgibacillus phage Mimir87]
MIFNGIEKDYLTVLRGRKRPVITKIEHEMARGRIRRTKLEALEVIVPVLIEVPKGFVLEEIKEDFSGWLFHYEDKRLMFKDNPNRYYMARLEEIDLDDHDRYADGDIKFICQNPYRFGKNKELNITTDFNSFTITGQTATSWTSETMFSADRDKYELEIGNSKILLNFKFVEGDKLLIDFDKRSVKLRERDIAVAVSLQTDWTELSPGPVSIRASEPTTIYYDERYY